MIINNITSFWYKTTAVFNDPREVPYIYNIYQVYKYLIFFPLLGLSTLILTLMSLPIIWLLGQRAGQISGILWARFNSMITPMWLKVEGDENVDPNQSYVIMANHQSNFDIFAIYGWLGIDFRWVMKAELRKAPVLGYYCYKAGHIFIDRSNHDSAVESINIAKKKIVNGTSIMFFPEGTRSNTGELLEFKKGAFIFALETGLPVLPVTINGTGKIQPNGTIGLFPGSASITIHRPVDSSAYDVNTIDRFMETVRNTIKAGLE